MEHLQKIEGHFGKERFGRGESSDPTGGTRKLWS
ncbi:MAG: hypothetical protein QOE82_1669 [Thermoanaerobaculia bacterium]|jgi:hypothetical protein|nr:hypothetical protein [Thermoanaerobaculia bacterium]